MNQQKPPFTPLPSHVDATVEKFPAPPFKTPATGGALNAVDPPVCRPPAKSKTAESLVYQCGFPAIPWLPSLDQFHTPDTSSDDLPLPKVGLPILCRAGLEVNGALAKACKFKQDAKAGGPFVPGLDELFQTKVFHSNGICPRQRLKPRHALHEGAAFEQ